MIKLIYVIVINALAFTLMGWDKYCSIKDYWRISENNLIGLAFLGGAPGMFLGMLIFHHKTKKDKFKILIPIFILINLYFYFK